MRLLYVCSDFGIAPAGTKGASIHLRAITAALAARGHEVLLLSPREGPEPPHPAKRLLPPGCPEVEGWSSDLRTWLMQRGLDAGVSAELRSLAYNSWALERAKASVKSEPPAAIVERLALLGHLGVDLADELHVPLVLEVNALMTEESERFRSLHLGPLAAAIEQKALKRADAVITVSRALAHRIAARGVDRRRIRVVPNGVEVDPFVTAPAPSKCRQALGLNGGFVVGFSGSLKMWHGVETLLEAFECLYARDADARLLIVGSGPTESALRERARRIGNGDAVIFTGAVPHGRIPSLLRAMDVAVAPFQFMEPFYFSPIKLFEYMASGACVVASRVGQIKEVIEDGVNGLLCEPDSAAALHRTLERARRDAPLRHRLAAEALRTVRSRYTWEHAARRTEAVIRRAIRGWTS